MTKLGLLLHKSNVTSHTRSHVHASKEIGKIEFYRGASETSKGKNSLVSNYKNRSTTICF